MKPRIRCAHCACLIHPDPRVKNQRYCGAKDCQRARKGLWQKDKLARDPDYKQNQQDSQKRWNDRNPEYWKNYRRLHPEYADRNRRQQRDRDSTRSRRGSLAKMDASQALSIVKEGTYYLTPASSDLAKMDALAQKVLIIPAS